VKYLATQITTPNEPIEACYYNVSCIDNVEYSHIVCLALIKNNIELMHLVDHELEPVETDDPDFLGFVINNDPTTLQYILELAEARFTKETNGNTKG
jgi:hypothetical protein